MSSSADIIEQISGHLENAYDAVDTQGGDVPALRTFTDLAQSIASIKNLYGTLSYYSGTQSLFNVSEGYEGCSPVVNDQDAVLAFYEENAGVWIGFEHEANTEYWAYYANIEGGAVELQIPDEDFESVTGISPNRESSTSHCWFDLWISLEVDTESELASVALSSTEDLSLLNFSNYIEGENNYHYADINGTRVYALSVQGFEWGTANASEYMPEYFLKYCTNLVELSTCPSWLTTIPTGFLSGCTSFNQPLDLSNVESIGNYFLERCISFDSSLDLSNVISIDTYFLEKCTSFNQTLDLSNVESIGKYFLYGCTAFNQDITIPATIAWIDGYFMYNCNSMTSIVTCETSAVVATSNNYTFATTSRSAACYTTGITLAGTYASEWHSRFPDVTTGNRLFRKTIVSES